MPIFQKPTTSSTDTNDIVGTCFFTGREVKQEDALLIGVFHPMNAAFESFTILVHKDNNLKGLDLRSIRRMI